MNDLFVPYELALELRKLGFDEPCISWFNVFGKFSNDYSAPKKYNSEFKVSGGYISAPTFSQAFKFFREKYNYNHSIVFTKHPFGTNEYQYVILLEDDEYVDINFRTYEEAELECLRKLIEIAKHDKKIKNK